MTESLVWEDYLTVGIYFAVVLAVGLWVSIYYVEVVVRVMLDVYKFIEFLKTIIQTLHFYSLLSLTACTEVARLQYADRERSGSVVEYLTRDRRATGSSLTGVTALWSLSKTHYPSLVLVQPRKTPPYLTERLLMGRKETNQTKSMCRSRGMVGGGRYVRSPPPPPEKAQIDKVS